MAAFYTWLKNDRLGKTPSLIDDVDEDNGWTVLHYAAKANDVLVIKNLQAFRYKLFTQKRGHRGETPLMLAAKSGGREVVELLLKQDPDAEAFQDDAGWTALHYAVYGNQIEVYDVFSKALFFVKDNKGHTPLILAVTKGYNDSVFELVRAAPATLDFTTVGGNTALHMAALHDDGATVLILAEMRGVSSTMKNLRGETPLTMAIRLGHWAVAYLLAEVFPKSTTITTLGKLPQLLAMEAGEEKLSAYLKKMKQTGRTMKQSEIRAHPLFPHLQRIRDLYWCRELPGVPASTASQSASSIADYVDDY